MVTILREAIQTKDSEIGRIVSRSNKARPIFNPDKRRLQISVNKNLALCKRLSTVLEDLNLLEGRSMGSIVVLRSQANCKQQPWHTDYDPNQLKNVQYKPLGVILALQDNTFFEEYPNACHILNRGDILIFEGDVIHAGAAYADENIRIHAYIDSNEVKRAVNKTYIFKEDS